MKLDRRLLSGFRFYDSSLYWHETSDNSFDRLQALKSLIFIKGHYRFLNVTCE